MKVTARKMAWILSILMVFSLLAGNPQLEVRAQGTGTTFKVNITNNSNFQNGNMVFYKFEEAEGWQQASDGVSIDIADKLQIIIYVERADAGEVAATVTESSGALTVNNDEIFASSGQTFSLSSDTSYELNITFTNNSGGTNPPQNIQNPEEITVNLTFPNSADESWMEGVSIDGSRVSNGKVTVEQASTHLITIQCVFGKTLGSIKINGEAMTLSSEMDTATFMRTDATVYNIEITLGSGGTRTIAWDNEGSLGSDAKVEHGKVEIVAVAGITDMTQDAANGGLYAVQPGTPVTIRLIPDYGYQLKSTDLNGATVAAGSEVSTFTFAMPDTNLHLAALFEKTEDKIDCAGSAVVSGASIANGGNAASSGNLSLTVEDNTGYNTDVTGVVSGTGVTKVASLDLTLDNIVGKGDGTYWEKNVTEFTNDINVGLTLDAGALGAGETYGVVRDHNGVLTELPATYDAATGVLTFPTNQFSTYTIVKKNAATGNTDATSNNTSSGSAQTTTNSSNSLISPQTGERVNVVLWILLALVSGGVALGVTAYGRKKNSL